jgi:apolipoprotein D and lipocalin family protein
MPPPEVVPQTNLSRYAGTKYEIASFPQWFQRGCVDKKAVYALRSDGTVEVLIKEREFDVTRHRLTKHRNPS